MVGGRKGAADCCGLYRDMTALEECKDQRLNRGDHADDACGEREERVREAAPVAEGAPRSFGSEYRTSEAVVDAITKGVVEGREISGDPASVVIEIRSQGSDAGDGKGGQVERRLGVEKGDDPDAGRDPQGQMSPMSHVGLVTRKRGGKEKWYWSKKACGQGMTGPGGETITASQSVGSR